MLPFLTGGLSCLPDGAVDAPEPLRPTRSLGWSAVLFLGAYVLLQWGWSEARGSWVERLVIDQMTVKTAASLIGTFDPAIGVQAVGSRLKAAGGGINILNGCEGIEVIFLLACGMLVAPLVWRARLLGFAVGSLIIFVLNQGRVIGLFYAFRINRGWFDTLHGLVAPLLMILVAAMFFVGWLKRYGSQAGIGPHE